MVIEMKKFLFLITMLMILYLTGCYNYRGWKEVKIPTDGLLQGTVKIPNNCEFILEDGMIKLIDNDSKEVYAEQIAEGYYEGKEISDNEQKKINNNLDDSFFVESNYTHIKGYSNAVY